MKFVCSVVGYDVYEFTDETCKKLRLNVARCFVAVVDGTKPEEMEADFDNRCVAYEDIDDVIAWCFDYPYPISYKEV